MEKELIKERFKLLAPLLNERNLRLYTANWYKLRFLETYFIALYDMIDS